MNVFSQLKYSGIDKVVVICVLIVYMCKHSVYRCVQARREKAP